MKAHRIFAKVKSFVLREGLIREGDAIIAAVSGGPDSVAMLDMLLRLRRHIPFSVTVAHYNHRVRGAESDRDETFVRELARREGLDFVFARRKASKKMKTSESELRKARYRFLLQLADQMEAKIALAHHRNDQVETVLMRIFRGTGVKGLPAMRPVSGPLIRPLLCLWRYEIEDYVHERRLEYVDDVTNRDERIPRNFLRLRVIPMVEKMFPGASDAVLRLAESAYEDTLFLEALARRFISHASLQKETAVYSLDELRSLPVALRKRLIRITVETITGNVPSWKFVDQVENIVFSTEAVESKGSGVYVYREGHYLVITRGRKNRKVVYRYMVENPGTTLQIVETGVEITFEEETGPAVAFDRTCEAVVDMDKIVFPLCIRTWKAGDRFLPFGGPGQVKLKEFFVAEGVPSHLRHYYPVVEDARGEIIWIAPLRIGQKVAVSATTRRILKMCIKIPGD